jgi:hypothetical protein
MFPRVTHPSATNVLLRPFDLHVLSLPPAFALSQDQTLRFDERLFRLVTAIQFLTEFTSIDCSTVYVSFLKRSPPKSLRPVRRPVRKNLAAYVSLSVFTCQTACIWDSIALVPSDSGTKAGPFRRSVIAGRTSLAAPSVWAAYSPAFVGVSTRFFQKTSPRRFRAFSARNGAVQPCFGCFLRHDSARQTQIGSRQRDFYLNEACDKPMSSARSRAQTESVLHVYASFSSRHGFRGSGGLGRNGQPRRAGAGRGRAVHQPGLLLVPASRCTGP